MPTLSAFPVTTRWPAQHPDRLQLYSVPQLHFVYDDSTESGLKISKLIDAAIADDRKHPSS